MSKIDKCVITILASIITILLLVIGLTSCKNNYTSTEFRLDLGDVVETGFGNTVDGDSMYWAIYEEWDNDCTRHLLYMDKTTFDSLELAVEEFSKAGLTERDVLNSRHNFTLLRDSEGLHLCSKR